MVLYEAWISFERCITGTNLHLAFSGFSNSYKETWLLMCISRWCCKVTQHLGHLLYSLKMMVKKRNTFMHNNKISWGDVGQFITSLLFCIRSSKILAFHCVMQSSVPSLQANTSCFWCNLAVLLVDLHKANAFSIWYGLPVRMCGWMNSTTTLRCDVKAFRNTEVKLILFKKGTASFKQKKKPHFSPFAALRAYFACVF